MWQRAFVSRSTTLTGRRSVAVSFEPITGFVCGLLAMVGVLAFTRIDFTWHTLIGSAVTMLVGNGCRVARGWFAPAEHVEAGQG